MSTPCGHDQARQELVHGLPTPAQLAALRALISACPDCKRWWSQRCEAEVMAEVLAARAPEPPPPPARWALLLIPAVVAAGIAVVARPSPPAPLTLGDASVAGVVRITDASGRAVEHPFRAQDAELHLVAPADAWVSLDARQVRLPAAEPSGATLLGWAAGAGRVDLVLRERLTRGSEEVAAQAPQMPPQQVAVGQGVDLVLAVLPGEVTRLPDTVTPGDPLGGLPAEALAHHIHVAPAR